MPFDINSVLKGFAKDGMLVTLPKHNWRVYQREVRMSLLHDLELWKIISKPDEKPTDTSLLAKWNERDETDALAIIWKTIADSGLRHKELKEVTTGSEAWKILSKRFDKDVRSHRFATRRRFNHAVHNVSRPVADYVDSITDAADDLKAINCEPNVTEIVDMIIMNLDISFDPIKTSLTSNPNVLTAAIVRAELIEWEATRNAPKSTDMTNPDDGDGLEPASALRVSSHQRKDHVHRQSNHHRRPASPPSDSESDRQRFSWGKPRSEGCCDRCGKPGHISRNCIFDMPSKVKDDVIKTAVAEREKVRASNAAIRQPDSDDESDDGHRASSSRSRSPSRARSHYHRSRRSRSRSYEHVYISRAMMDMIQL